MKCSFGRGRALSLLLAFLVGALLLPACSPSVAASIQGAPWLDPHRGAQGFEKHGCDLCHTVVEDDSTAAISLADLPERRFLAVGAPNTPENVIRFIQDPKSVHPSATMPKLNVPEAEALDIAVYLYNLSRAEIAPAAPTVTISPQSGPPGTQVSVQATGLPPETATRVGVARAGGSFEASVMALTDARGMAIASVAVPVGALAGEKWVVQVRSMADEAVEVQSAVFRVTSDLPARPVVRLSPGFGPPGTEVRVEGKGLPPDATVEVGFGNLDSPPTIVRSVRSDAEGGFSLTLQVPQSARPGQAWVAIVTATGDVEAASPDFLVTQPAGDTTIYVVQAGDTLGSIARRFGITVANILEANPEIGDPDRISVGQALRLPRAEAAGDELLLPDLQPLPAGELTVASDPQSGTRQIRYSTTIVNIGHGPLALLGQYNPAVGQTQVSQIIETADGAAVSRTAGYFVHHPEHGHWHYEDFNVVELWSYRADGSLQDLVTTTGKTTFCISDMTRMASPPPGASAEPQFTECGQSLQGISVGWEDTYGPELPGQHLDITGVPDGRYAIRIVVNPDGLISETNTANNVSVRHIEIQGDSIRPIPAP
ncbi:MAG: LysM peptidoglycan-binding domain-containing protein [Anaerolineae bacterium]|nr:LysM peptidoglycan-binding domain-containing protein [Anaerolineae bacterium]